MCLGTVTSTSSDSSFSLALRLHPFLRGRAVEVVGDEPFLQIPSVANNVFEISVTYENYERYNNNFTNLSKQVEYLIR